MKRRFSLPFVLLSMVPALAAPEQTVIEETPAAFVEGSVSVGAGGAFVSGDRAALEQHTQHDSRFFGGIEELRYRRETEATSFNLEFRAIPGDERYRLAGRWMQPDRWYVDFGYDRYRVFYDGSGRQFGPNGAWFPFQEDTLGVDRTRGWIELGLVLEDAPEFRLRYERRTRSGEKPSTELGETNLTGGFGSKAIVPSLLLLDETQHIVTADVRREHAEGRWAGGVRYEHTSYNNDRRNIRRPGEPAAARTVSTKESVDSDLFSTHGYYERRLGEKLTASAGALVATLDTNLGGGRVFATEFDAPFDPQFAQRQLGDVGFLGMGGGSQLKQYVFNGTVVYRPHKHWMIRPAVKYEHLQVDNLATFLATNVATPVTTSLQDSLAESEKDEDRATESLEIRYTGKPSWTFTARGEWSQTSGDLEESLSDAGTGSSLIARRTDYTRAWQKYALSAVWYAKPGLSMTAQYYFRLRLNDYDPLLDSTPPAGFNRYPAYIANQDFTTHDINVRVSWRPLSKISLVSRYDLQRSDVVSSFEGIPETQSAESTAHIFSQSVTWTPIPRLYVLGSVNVAFDQLATPAAAFVRNSDNNYVSSSVAAGYAWTKRTDLFVDASHYSARNYSDNSTVSLPYGSDQTLETLSLTAVTRLNEQLTYTLRYTYAQNTDRGSGGRNDYEAHFVYGRVQYRF